jgi:hypothetical protein
MVREWFENGLKNGFKTSLKSMSQNNWKRFEEGFGHGQRIV